jgi:regulator of sirC expression with transglutaminase-like and TPR domain
MDARGDSEDVVQVEASGRREGKMAAAARKRSIEYETIIEDTVAGSVGNTPDERRKIYAHARSAFLHRLWLMELPEPVVELEKLALDLAIGKIERRWGAQDAAEKSAAENVAAEKLAAERAIPFNIRAPRIEPPGTAIMSSARLSRRLARPIGVAVALPAITAAIFFGLDMGSNGAYRSVVRDLVERLLVHPGGDLRVPGPPVARDALADHGPARSAQIPAALAAGPQAPAPSLPSAAGGGGRGAGRGIAETPRRESEPLWLDGVTAFSDMTWGSGPANALSGPTVAAEDFAVGRAMPFGTLAPDAAPTRPDAAPTPPDAAPYTAGPQAPPPPVMRPVNVKVAALVATGKQAALKGDLDRAVHDFGEAIRIDPKYPDTYLERGQTFFKLGDTERAIADYSAALAHDPQYGAALRARGMAQLYLGKTDLALADLSKAIELGERDPQVLAPIELFYARRSRGSIYEAKQQYDLEIADCTALIDSYAHDPTLVDALADNYGSAGAANILARVYRQRATAFARRSSVERAVADLTQAIPLSSDQGYAALIDRSKLHEGLGRNDLAAADARAALNIRPGSEEARLALSRLSALANPTLQKGL